MARPIGHGAGDRTKDRRVVKAKQASRPSMITPNNWPATTQSKPVASDRVVGSMISKLLKARPLQSA